MKTQELESYGAAALMNAEELVLEASLLHEHGHYARAYFLAVAAIEEIGKSIIAFDAQGRNLGDPAVASKVKRLLADHDAKIRSAFIGFLTEKPRTNVEIAVELMLQLQRGRQPAMYTDQAPDGSIRVPAKVVRERAAADCIRLSNHCLASARNYLETSRPVQKSRAEDQVFALKPAQISELMKKEDFWWFYVSRLESDQLGYADAVVQYRKDYELPGRLFNEAVPASSQDA